VRLDLGRHPSWGSDKLSIGEILPVARALSDLVSQSRALDARDLEMSELAEGPALDLDEMGARVDRLVEAFTDAHSRLDILLANSSGASAEQLRTALLPLTYFDVSAVPVNAAGDQAADRQSLLDQAAAVRTETARRVQQLQQLVADVDRARMSPTERFDLERERVAHVLGKAFRILPRFKATNAPLLNEALPASDALLAGDRLAPLTLLQQMARVRAGTAKLNDVFTFTQCVTPGIQPELRVVQLPHRAAARWAALPFEGDKPPEATMSLLLYVPGGFGNTIPPDVSGLMIDEWIDVTPRSAEQTGIAFNYNAPGSRPPQVILLAVPPGDQTVWDIETLETIVLETLELAKLRMVEPSRLDDEVSYFLPALYFELNLAGDTISTDFPSTAKVPGKSR
jgi:hypothetical protein